MNDADREFLEAVKSAIRQTVRDLESRRSGETLAGYGLSTDDGLETLGHQTITREALQSAGDTDLLFMTNDWPFEAEQSLFDDALRLLRQRAGSTGDLKTHVDTSFELLVAALAELRGEELFPPGVFLTVFSTDPSEYLEKMEDLGIEKLNGPDVIEARRAFLQKWL